MNHLQSLLASIESRFRKQFKCIQSDCDGNGHIPRLVSVNDDGEENWESDQCEFHGKYLIPIEDFIKQSHEEIIQAAKEEERERILAAIEKAEAYCTDDGLEKICNCHHSLSTVKALLSPKKS